MFTECKLCPNTVLSNRYEVLSEIGAGGMGCVYLATDLKLQRKVAIKHLITPTEASLNEAQLLAKINHPHIVQVHDVVTENDAVFIVMEYVGRGTLYQAQKESGFTYDEQLKILVQVCSGVVAAHQKGIVHCDLKPSNILIDQEGNAKISDFGIARFNQASNNPIAINTNYLTTSYSSPELILQQKCDHRSDFFSLGIIAYQLLYGIHPFGKQREQQYQRILSGEYLTPAESITRANGISQDIPKLLCQLLQANPNARPNSSQFVLDVLEQELLRVEGEQENATCLVTGDDRNAKACKSYFINAKLLAVIFITVVAFFGVISASEFNKLDTRFVLVAPPKLVTLNERDNKNYFLLTVSVENAIRQAVLNTRKMELISNKDISFTTSNISEIGVATRATDILVPTVSCSGTNCNVRLETLTGPNWRVAKHVQWAIAADDHLSILQTTSVNFAAMFKRYKEKYATKITFSDSEYIEYLQILNEVRKKGGYTEENKDLLLNLISRSPYLYEAYSLLQDVVLDLFYQQKKVELLEQLRNVLVSSPVEYKATPYYAVNQFYLSIELSKFKQAKRQLEAMHSWQIDPYLYNTLAAELALKQDKLAQAMDFFVKAIAVRQTHKVLFAAATTSFQLGNFEESIRYLNKIARESTEHYKGRVLLANIYLAQGKVKKAIPLYEQELESQEQAETLNNLAIAYSLNSEPSKALSQVRKIDLETQNTGLLLNVADIEKISGEQSRAREIYERIIELTNDDESYYALLDRAQSLAQLSHYSEAIMVLNRAIRTQPESSEYAFTAALVYSLANETRSALVQVNEAIKVGYPSIWFNSAWFVNLCGNTEFNVVLQELENSICKKNGATS